MRWVAMVSYTWASRQEFLINGGAGWTPLSDTAPIAIDDLS